MAIQIFVSIVAILDLAQHSQTMDTDFTPLFTGLQPRSVLYKHTQRSPGPKTHNFSQKTVTKAPEPRFLAAFTEALCAVGAVWLLARCWLGS